MLEELKQVYAGWDVRKKAIFWAVAILVVLSLVRLIAWMLPARQGIKPQKYEKMLFSKDERQVRDAMLMLAALKYKEASPSLVRLMEESADANTRRMAAETLLKLDQDKLLSQLKSQKKEVKETVREVVYRCAPHLLGKLFEDYGQEDIETKLTLLSYAANSKRPELRDRLVKAFCDSTEDPRVRTAAGGHLKELGTPEDTALLWQVYTIDQDPQMRTLAKEVIDQIEARRRAGGSR